MQSSGGSRTPTPPPLGSTAPAAQGRGHTTTTRPAQGSSGAGGVFDDYTFRFSKTYTAVDPRGAGQPESNRSGPSFGLPRQPPAGAASSSPTQTFVGPRSMLANPPQPTPLEASSSTSQRGKRNAKAETTAGAAACGVDAGVVLPFQSASQRAVIDQEAATRVMSLLSNRKTVSAPLPQTQRAAASFGASSHSVTGIDTESSGGPRTNSRRVPSTRPLPPPVLGKAAGAVHMSNHAGHLSLSADTRAEVMEEALDPHEVLFHAWQHRQQLRLAAGRRLAIEQQLDTALSDAVYGLLVEEEDYWIQELSHSQMKGREMSVNPKLKPYGTSSAAFASTAGGGQDMVAFNNGLSAVGATSRGVSVPLNFMESLFKGLRALLHQRTVTLLTSLQANKLVLAGDKCTIAAAGATVTDASPNTPTPPQSREDAVNAEIMRRAEEEEQAYVNAIVASETDLAKHAVKDAENSLLPSCVSLPPERVLAPVLTLETATSAVLLWKILLQAQSVIPHMSFALTLYVNYIMPHLYDNFALYARSLPQQVGSLSEQVRQLTQLPLRARADLAASETLAQATGDLAYMETTLKAWALRSWRATVLAERRVRRQRAALEAAMVGLRRRTQVKQVFDAWRLAARESAQETYMGNIESEYHAFLRSSGIVAQVERFPLLGTGEDGKSTAAGAGAGGGGSRLGGTAYNRAKFLATKLAESAEHHKPVKRSGDGAAEASTTPVLPPVSLSNSSGGGAASTRGGGGRNAARAGGQAVSFGEAVVSTPAAAAEGSPLTANTAASPIFAASDFGAVATPPAQSDGEDTGFSTRAFQATTTTTFDTMLGKLREMEEVCSHLQSEIVIQNNRIAKLEQEKFTLSDRNKTLEEKLLEALREKLHYCNVVQEKQLLLNDRTRRIAQLKSRLRAHRSRPWQKTVLRVIGEFCGASTQLSEANDELRLIRESASNGATKSGAAAEDAKTSNQASTRSRKSGSTEVGAPDPAAGATAEDEGEAAFAAQKAEEHEDRRLFGRLAPVVLSTTQNLPDALVILQDWVNSCLDDLESLDDIKGGALSLRVTTFSEELRNGVLFSRLLYYLALPRYLHSSGANSTSGEEDGGKDGARRQHGNAGVRRQLVAAAMGRTGSDAEEFFAPDYNARRMQLLERRQVQLETPFPVYSECFGDLLNMRLSDRMTLLLQFATELVMGQEPPQSESVENARVKLRGLLYTTLGLSEPPSSGRLELTEVIDPHALAMGERASSVTLVALLYTRFSHPFNHKCKQSAALERASILYLLSGGQWLQEECARMSASAGPSAHGDGAVSLGSVRATSVSAQQQQGAAQLSSVEQELLASLDDEDKSPWQLFKERCLPAFGSAAHPFLLRGNFWPSDAFDSPDLAELLGELGMALNRSLQVHRWHVTISCLVPVLTYSGLSRGVFTGPRTSPTALRVGLEREGQWAFPLRYSHLENLLSRRVALIQKAVISSRVPLSDLMRAPSLEEQEASLYYASPMGSSRASGAATTTTTGGNHSTGRSQHSVGAASAAGQSGGSPPPSRQPRGSFFVPPSSARRETAIGDTDMSNATPASVLEALRSRERGALMTSLQMILDDMLTFFATRATLNAELALPVMDLHSWRIFCADLQLMQLQSIVGGGGGGAGATGLGQDASGEAVVDDRPDVTRPVRLLDMETATQIFHLAVLSYLDIDAGGDGGDGGLGVDATTGLSTPRSTAASAPDLAAFATHTPKSALVGLISPTGTASSSGRVSPKTVVVLPTATATITTSSTVPLPTVRSYMMFPAFAMALTLVADYLYPHVLVSASPDSDEDDDNNSNSNSHEGDENNTSAKLVSGGVLDMVDAPGTVAAALTPRAHGKTCAVRWLGDALSQLVQRYMVTNVVVAESTAGALFDDPQSVIARLTSGLRTQEMLNWYSPCIVAVYNAYSREVFGLAALQAEDIMRLLRDAMLTSTEISQYLITELFQHCAVTHNTQDEAVIAKRREIDGKPREGTSSTASGDKRKGGRSVRIVDPRSSTTSAATAPSTDVKVLNYDGFVQLLCVLCVFKQPNPLVAFDQRLAVFLRRSLLRPLTHKVNGLSMLLNQCKMSTRGAPGMDGDDKNKADAEAA